MANNFLRVKCDECGNEQKTFSRASSNVDCLVCGETIASPTGGKVDVNGGIVEELEVE
ncbi:MAG: 30S ribosomal protein S27e [Candidatus Nanohaloarchaea archaeon]